MPELPEVETVCRALAKLLSGKRITSVHVLRRESIGYPKPREFARRLSGHVFKTFARRGKYLLIGLDKGAGLAVHLRMSGRLLLINADQRTGKHVRVCMKLEDGQELRFEDMRVFGRLWYVPAGQTFEQIVPGLSKLGAEPLDPLGSAQFKMALQKCRRAVKSALLDQAVIAGIGNIYADEALFASGINPAISCQDLTAVQFKRLQAKIGQVLRRAIKRGGSSIRDYIGPDGVNGSYQAESWVYGRVGLPCRRCLTPIKRIRLAGRSTHFCPQCQPLVN